MKKTKFFDIFFYQSDDSTSLFTDKTKFRHFGHGQSLEGGVNERSNLLRGFQPGPENSQNLVKNLVKIIERAKKCRLDQYEISKIEDSFFS